jgi:hypothetical protein
MKKHTLIIFFLAFVFLVSTKAFALVDAAFVGGYTFEGKIKIGQEYFRDITGYQFGSFAHLNVNTDIFLLGFGIAYQQGAFTYEAHDEEQEFKLLSSWGPDIIFMLNVSSTTRPYGRLGFSFVDNLQYDYRDEYKDKTRYLNSGWFALGVGQVVVPSVIIFAEFQRYVTHMNRDHSMCRYMANVGVMFVY